MLMRWPAPAFAATADYLQLARSTVTFCQGLLSCTAFALHVYRSIYSFQLEGDLQAGDLDY
jgi:hypothetical protein